jgi:hypothetical protein
MIAGPPRTNHFDSAVTAPRSDNNRRRSVVQQPALNGARTSFFNIMLDGHKHSPSWGTSGRDVWLRNFYRQEPILAGAIQATASKYASFTYNLKGPPKSRAAVQNILSVSEHGRGWTRLWLPTITDYLTQDNGAFIEVVRAGPQYTDAVVGLNHLDAAKCIRTGRWDTPVVYVDRDNHEHLMKWYQIMDLVDNPTPTEENHGMQLCGVSRALSWAQIMSEVAVYKLEKVSGTFARQVNVFNGVSAREVNDAIEQHMDNTHQAGLQRYSLPVLLSAMDHRATLSQIVIQLASLPEDWNEETANTWYCHIVALDLGIDPQDIVPMHGRSSSSGSSEMLHLKARGKGAALFQTQVKEQFTNQGIIPKNLELVYEEQDTMEQKDQAQLRLLRAQERAVRIKSGELTPQVARQIAVDEGDLDEDYLALLAETDLTPTPGFGNDNVASGQGVQPGSQPGAANAGLSRKDVRPLAQSGFPTNNKSSTAVR